MRNRTKWNKKIDVQFDDNETMSLNRNDRPQNIVRCNDFLARVSGIMNISYKVPYNFSL